MITDAHELYQAVAERAGFGRQPPPSTSRVRVYDRHDMQQRIDSMLTHVVDVMHQASVITDLDLLSDLVALAQHGSHEAATRTLDRVEESLDHLDCVDAWEDVEALLDTDDCMLTVERAADLLELRDLWLRGGRVPRHCRVRVLPDAAFRCMGAMAKHPIVGARLREAAQGWTRSVAPVLQAQAKRG